MPNGIGTWENSFAISYEVKHIFTVQVTVFTPKYLPQRNGSIRAHRGQ